MGVDNATLAKHFLRFRQEKQKEKKPMSTDREKRPCEGCGQIKPLSSSYEKLVCASCLNVRGSAKLRPVSVVNALREFHGSLVQWLSADEVDGIVVSCGSEPRKTDVAETQKQIDDVREIRAEVDRLIAEKESLQKQLADAVLDRGNVAELNKSFAGQLDHFEGEIAKLSGANVSLNAENEELVSSLQNTAIELEQARADIEILKNQASAIDKAKLSSLLADIGQGVLDGKKKLSGRVYRELRKLAA